MRNRRVLQLASITNSVNVRNSEAGTTLELLPLVIWYWYSAMSYECTNYFALISAILSRNQQQGKFAKPGILLDGEQEFESWQQQEIFSPSRHQSGLLNHPAFQIGLRYYQAIQTSRGVTQSRTQPVIETLPQGGVLGLSAEIVGFYVFTPHTPS